MSSYHKFLFEEVPDGKDGWERTGWLTLDGKKILVPNYCVPIGRSPYIDDLELRLRISGETTGHTGSYVIRAFNYDRILRDRIAAIDQSTITGEGYQRPVFRNFHFGDVYMSDSSAESLEYTRYLSKLARSKRTPPVAQDLANEIIKLDTKNTWKVRKAMVWNFWGRLQDERTALQNMLRHSFNYGSETTASVLLPFQIVVRHHSSFAIAKLVNDYWKERCGFGGKLTVNYLMLSTEALSNHDLVSEICEYIEGIKTEVAVLKIKNANFSHAEAYEHLREYGRILTAYARLRHNRFFKTTTIALECGRQTFLNAIKSFDIVSTSLSSSDAEKESTGGANPPVYGSALDLDTMIPMTFNWWSALFKKFGQWPDNHAYCKANITTVNKKIYPMERWNSFDRRIHNALVVDEWMHQVSEGIREGEGKLIPQKLHNSQLRVLTEAVPMEGRLDAD